MQQWQLLTQFWDKLQQPGMFTTLIRGASTALTIQTVGAGVGYLLQVLLARWMGVSAYGTYDYVMTISMVLAFLSGLGLSGAVLRFVPTYVAQQNWSYLRGVVWGSWWQTVIASLVLATVATPLVFHWVSDLDLLLPLILGIWLVPLLALQKLQLELLRGVRQIALAYAPSVIVYPILLMGSMVLWQQTQGMVTSAIAIGLSVLVLALVLIGQLWGFQHTLPAEVSRVRPTYALRQWLLVSLPLLFIDGSFMVLNQTDTLMIGSFLGTEAVGIYGAAFKTATWVSFILHAVNAIAAPMFAALYAQDDRAALQRLVSKIAQWIFYPALLVAIGLFVFAEPVLHLFGSEFVAAKWALMALCLGQLVNVGTGSVGYLLTMTGHQNQCAVVVGCSALLNLLLNLIGIPRFGILGAAMATAFSMALWNIWLNRLVVKYLGVNPSIIAALKRW